MENGDGVPIRDECGTEAHVARAPDEPAQDPHDPTAGAPCTALIRTRAPRPSLLQRAVRPRNMSYVSHARFKPVPVKPLATRAPSRPATPLNQHTSDDKKRVRAPPKRNRKVAFLSRSARVRKRTRAPRPAPSASEACRVLVNFVDGMQARENLARELYYEARDAHHFTTPGGDDSDSSRDASASSSDPWDDDDCGSEHDSEVTSSNDTAESLGAFIDDDENSLEDSNSEYAPSCASQSASSASSRSSTASSGSPSGAEHALARNKKYCPCIHCAQLRSTSPHDTRGA